MPSSVPQAWIWRKMLKLLEPGLEGVGDQLMKFRSQISSIESWSFATNEATEIKFFGELDLKTRPSRPSHNSNLASGTRKMILDSVQIMNRVDSGFGFVQWFFSGQTGLRGKWCAVSRSLLVENEILWLVGRSATTGSANAICCSSRDT